MGQEVTNPHMREYRRRQVERGFKEISIWVPSEKVKEVRAYARRLRDECGRLPDRRTRRKPEDQGQELQPAKRTEADQGSHQRNARVGKPAESALPGRVRAGGQLAASVQIPAPGQRVNVPNFVGNNAVFTVTVDGIYYQLSDGYATWSKSDFTVDNISGDVGKFVQFVKRGQRELSGIFSEA